MPQPAPRSGDLGALFSYLYLVAAFCYAMTREFAYREAWSAMLLPFMLGEYVLAFAAGMALSVREHAEEGETQLGASRKAVLVILTFMGPFIWFVVAGLKQASLGMALGYLLTLGGRVWAMTGASPVSRERFGNRMMIPILAFLGCLAFFMMLFNLRPGDYALACGAMYFAILAAFEARGLLRDASATS